MALAPIQILGGRSTDAIGSVLGTGVNVLQNVLNTAVESGRKMADNQIRQEDAFVAERRDLRLLGERRGNELQRRYEAKRTFDESVTRDRRNFGEDVLRDRRNFERSVLTQDRAFGLDMAGLGLRGAELGLRTEESKLRREELGLQIEERKGLMADREESRGAIRALLGGTGTTTPSLATPSSSYLSAPAPVPEPAAPPVGIGVLRTDNQLPAPTSAPEPIGIGGVPTTQRDAMLDTITGAGEPVAPSRFTNNLTNLSDSVLEQLKFTVSSQRRGSGSYSPELVKIDEEIDRRSKAARAAQEARRDARSASGRGGGGIFDYQVPESMGSFIGG